MQRLLNEEGADDLVMTMGLGVVGAVYTNESERPRLQGDADRPADRGAGGAPRARRTRRSRPSTTWSTAWKKDPRSVTVGGGSSPGGPDHLFPMQLAKAVGIEPKRRQLHRVRRRRPADDRRCSARRSTSARPASASSRARSRTARCACSPSPATSASTTSTRPTLKESGVDLVFTNWRGVLAPPGHLRRDQREYLIDALHRDARHQGVAGTRSKRNGWIDAFATGDEFGTFLEGAGRARRHDPEGAGTRMSTTQQPPATPRQDRVVDKAQYGLAAVLGVVGGYVIYDADDAAQGLRRPAGPALRVPLRRRRRPGRARRPAGARHRARRPAPRPRRARTSTSPRAATGSPSASSSRSSSLNIALIDWLGWAITGALLFAGTARVLGSPIDRPRPRDRRRPLGRHLVRLLRRPRASRSRPASWTECSDGILRPAAARASRPP